MKALTLADRLPRPRWNARYYWWRGMHIQDYRYHNAIRRIARTDIERFAPDVVHCMHCYLSAAVANIDTPYIATCHGLEIDDAPPIRECLSGAAIIHSNSNFTKRRAQRIVPNGPHRVLTWGIKTSQERPRPQPTYDLITLGRVVKRKNIETVLRALVEVPELRYRVAGDGPELPRLKAFVAEHRLGNVDFLGAVSDAQKRVLLADSRIFVMCPTNTNDDVEGLGLVYYEAHGAGLPVITADSGGAPEAVGDVGIVVPDPTNVADVRMAIERALEPRTLAQLSDAVKRRQATNSWTRFADAFEQTYTAARVHRKAS